LGQGQCDVRNPAWLHFTFVNFVRFVVTHRTEMRTKALLPTREYARGRAQRSEGLWQSAKGRLFQQKQSRNAGSN